MRRLTLLLTPLVLSACTDAITAPQTETPEALFALAESPSLTGLVAYWPLNGDAQDSGPSGLHGTVVGALPTADRNGADGAAMAVADGTHLAVPDDPLLDVTGSFTLAFWIRTPGAGAAPNFIIGKGRDVFDNYAFYRAGGSDDVRFYLRDGEYDPKIAEVSAPLTPDSWHHLAAVVDNGSTVILYRDGEAVSQSAMPRVFLSDNDHPLVFGRHYVTPEGLANDFPFPFTGTLDEVRLYDRALSAEEVALDMQGAFGGGDEGGGDGEDDEPIPPPPLDPVTKNDCKRGGWAAFGFRNQGQCIRFVQTGKDSR